MRQTRWATTRTILGVPFLVAFGFLAMLPVLGQDRDTIDFNRARGIRERFLKGEALSKEDRAYLERAKAAFARKGARPQPEPRASLALTPLVELQGDARYKGQAGGLYGGGKNTPTEATRKLADAAVGRIVPRDADGEPDADGKVVLLSVGMSNTTQEFRRFAELAGRDPAKSDTVVLVDGAQGGMDALAWAEPDRVRQAGRPDPWDSLSVRLKQARVSPSQVQVVWIKQARANPGALGEFPGHVDALRDNLQSIVTTLRKRFPNLQLAYFSSRIYAGFATTSLNPEPYAYESAFAVRNLINDQAKGLEELNADLARGKVQAPVLLWGPYLWANGTTPRKSDKLTWTRDDLAADGTHPSISGQQKVAEQLLRFFKSDPTATPWFLGRTRPADPR